MVKKGGNESSRTVNPNYGDALAKIVPLISLDYFHVEETTNMPSEQAYILK